MEIQELARFFEESDAAMYDGWTWAFPQTPFVLDRENCIKQTDAIFVKFFNAHK